MEKEVDIWQPTIYDSAHSLQKRDNTLVLNLFQRAFKPSKSTFRFLDIGCGVGDITRNLIIPSVGHPFEKIVAIDISEKMLSFAKKEFSHPQIEHVLQNVATIDQEFVKKYGPFNRIYSFYALHWLPEVRLPFEKLRMLLAPGGECLVTLSHKSNLAGMFTFFKQHPKWSKYTRPDDVQAYEPDKEEVSKVLTELGFSVHTFEVLNLSYTFKDKKFLVDTFASFCPAYNRVLKDEQPEFVKDLSSYLENTIDGLTSHYQTILLHISIN